MRSVILVPRRSDGGQRDRLWAFCRAWWEREHPDWPIFEGHHDDGPFNRSAAVNRAALDAGEWDVAIVIDSDIIANPDAIRTAAEIAVAAGRIVVSHNDRIMLNKVGTAKVLDGYRGPWRVRQMVERVYTDSVSCAIAVPRSVWDLVGGFDEHFAGWGYEDSAFVIAVETLTGKPLVRLTSELYHLHHPLSPEAASKAATRAANAERLDRYRAADGNPDAVRALLDDEPADLGPSRIPRIFHRTVPAETTEQVEQWWAELRRMHPGWQFHTWRDPLDPADWPLTGDLWSRCANGAQKAGLIRLEALVTHGGFYVDSDVEPVRSFEPLVHCPAVAAWEDERCIPDAVMGAEPQHPAFVTMLTKARSVIEGGGDAWHSGPGVSTEVLPGRPDVVVLPPGAFYPFHYLQKGTPTVNDGPWVFCRHTWAGSWLTPAQKRSQAKRQRA